MHLILLVLLGVAQLNAAGMTDPLHTMGIHPENCPVEIASFKVIRPTHVDRYCLGILWQNNQAKTITACEFRVICFDALKRFTEYKTAHMFCRAVASDEIHQSSAFFDHRIGCFESSYICVVPERVLFEDGSIWQCTDESVCQRIIDAIQSDVTAEVLKKTITELDDRAHESSPTLTRAASQPTK